MVIYGSNLVLKLKSYLNKDGKISIGPSGNRTYFLGGKTTNDNQAGDLLGYNESTTRIRI